MTKNLYLFVFKNKKNDINFSLGLNNTKTRIDEHMLSSAYLIITQSARKFAKKYSMKLEVLSSTDNEPSRIMDLSEYFFYNKKYNEKRLYQHLTWLKDKGEIPHFSIRIRVLPPPEELIGREEIIKKTKQVLKNHHISLQAPRAMGKTSILYVLSQEPFDDFKSHFIELKNIQTCVGFAGAIAYSLSNQKDENKREKMREEIEKKSEENILSTVKSLFSEDKKYLLLLDEFADFLRNIKESKDMEKFNNIFKELSCLKNVRFISASSESESRIIGKGNKIFDKIKKITIPPLKKEYAYLLMEELLYNASIYPEEKDVETSCELIGDFVPYFIHAFVSIWQDLKRKKKESIKPNDVYEEFLGITGWNLLREFQELPKRYPGDKSKGAYSMLKNLINNKIQKNELKNIYFNTTNSYEGFDDVIERLLDDLLIKKQGDFFEFRLKLLKDFWQRYPVK